MTEGFEHVAPQVSPLAQFKVDKPPPPVAPAVGMAQLYGALAKASAEFLPIAKNRNVRIPTKAGGAYNFRYADLEACIAAVRPALAKHGLAVLQPISSHGERTMLTTMLVHADGGVLTSTLPVPEPGQRDPKEYGALITYLRRYMLCAMLNIAADDDLDDAPTQGNRSLTASDMAELLDDIAKADTPEALRAAFNEAVDVATKAGDSDAVKRLTSARDARIKAGKKKETEPAA